MAQPLVPGPEIGMIAPARAARVGENENWFLVLHEGLGLGEIGMGWPVLDDEARAIRIDLAHDPPGTPGDLGDHVGPEALDDLVERALHRFH